LPDSGEVRITGGASAGGGAGAAAASAALDDDAFAPAPPGFSWRLQADANRKATRMPPRVRTARERDLVMAVVLPLGKALLARFMSRSVTRTWPNPSRAIPVGRFRPSALNDFWNAPEAS
jgi:hypothetical protein